jgi:hypothetical protein
MNSAQLTKAEIIAIIETYDGMLRVKWCEELLAIRTAWVARLAAR